MGTQWRGRALPVGRRLGKLEYRSEMAVVLRLHDQRFEFVSGKFGRNGSKILQEAAIHDPLSRSGERRHLVDGSPAPATHSRLRPALAIFLPERLALVKGPPANRRSHLDRLGGALWPARAEARRRYGRALAQRNAPLRFAFAEGELTVAAETPEVGDASESVPAPYSGEPLEIAFNPQFLIEGLESVEGEELVMKLSSPLRPGLLEPVGDEDFSYLVMPIRLNV